MMDTDFWLIRHALVDENARLRDRSTSIARLW